MKILLSERYKQARLHCMNPLYLALCFPGRGAMCEERCYGALCAGGSCSGLQVTEANVNEGEMEGSAAVHHSVEEFHGQRDQLDHSIIPAAYRHYRKQRFSGINSYTWSGRVKTGFKHKTAKGHIIKLLWWMPK